MHTGNTWEGRGGGGRQTETCFAARRTSRLTWRTAVSSQSLSDLLPISFPSPSNLLSISSQSPFNPFLSSCAHTLSSPTPITPQPHDILKMVNTTNEKAAGRRAQQLEQDNDALAQHNASLHQRLRAQTEQAEKTEETANTAQTEKTDQRLAHPAREASEDAREEGEGEGEGEGGQGAHATSTAAGNHSGEPEHGARQDCGGETAPGERPDYSGETEQREKLLQLLQLYLLNRHKKRRLERHCSLWSWRRRLLLQRHVCPFCLLLSVLPFVRVASQSSKDIEPLG